MKKINQRHPRKVILSGGCRDLVKTGTAFAARERKIVFIKLVTRARSDTDQVEKQYY